MERMRGSFSQIEDTRHASYAEHNLGDVLILIMCSVVSGITELANMMVYIASKKDFYSKAHSFLQILIAYATPLKIIILSHR